MNILNWQLFLIVTLLTSCSTVQINPSASSKMGLPNPASVYCVEQGGELKIMKDGKGEYGFCFFEDGSHCEEWQFFRKECTKGKNFAEE